MSEPARCRVVLPGFKMFGIAAHPCGRLLTDLCGVCQVFEAHKGEWAAMFNECHTAARVAVPGDIL